MIFKQQLQKIIGAEKPEVTVKPLSLCHFSVSLFMRSTDVSAAHLVTFSPSLVVLGWVKDETIVTQAQLSRTSCLDDRGVL